MPSSFKDRLPAKNLLTGWLIVEAIVVLYWLALLTWTAVVEPRGILPLIVYGFHLAATALAFVVVENLEERVHAAAKSSSGESTYVLKESHIQQIRQFGWGLAFFGVMITDTFSLVEFLLESHVEVEALRILTIILWSYAILTTLIYFVLALAYQAYSFRHKAKH